MQVFCDSQDDIMACAVSYNFLLASAVVHEDWATLHRPQRPIADTRRMLMFGAGLRIDPEMNSGSRMSYYTGLFLVNMTDDLVLPAPREATTPITGYPEGFWLNLVSWSQDGKHIAFTVRSPGKLVR